MIAVQKHDYHRTEKGKAVIAVQGAKRRALMRTPEVGLSAAGWLDILSRAKGRCFYCKAKAKLTLDHVVPLSRGGQHVKENVVAACLSCNSKKGNRLWLLI
ncbi:hypothetical protein LCGC14_0312850 [marine sediment metagenome]|uniref:HNH nuclease domain-containing protein n=1 Tax=marine sediment metagenome TaxID=412755 RepID=A0A0F9WT67_9ZZZZ